MSLHQTGFQEVLAAAELTGQFPEEMLLISVQPAELEDYGGSLSPAVKAQVAAAVELAVARLQAWGFVLAHRTKMDGAPAARLNDPALDLDADETGRPSALSACRHGDARILGRNEPYA